MELRIVLNTRVYRWIYVCITLSVSPDPLTITPISSCAVHSGSSFPTVLSPSCCSSSLVPINSSLLQLPVFLQWLSSTVACWSLPAWPLPARTPSPGSPSFWACQKPVVLPPSSWTRECCVRTPWRLHRPIVVFILWEPWVHCWALWTYCCGTDRFGSWCCPTQYSPSTKEIIGTVLIRPWRPRK